jgi:hypothetical protein
LDFPSLSTPLTWRREITIKIFPFFSNGLSQSVKKIPGNLWEIFSTLFWKKKEKLLLITSMQQSINYVVEPR